MRIFTLLYMLHLKQIIALEEKVKVTTQSAAMFLWSSDLHYEGTTNQEDLYPLQIQRHLLRSKTNMNQEIEQNNNGLHSIEGTFLWAVSLFGITENVVIVLTSVLTKKFHRPLHLFISVLAMTDLFTCLVYVPTYTYYLLDENSGIVEANNQLWHICGLVRYLFLQLSSIALTIKTLIGGYLYFYAVSNRHIKDIFSTQRSTFYVILAVFFNLSIILIPTVSGLSMVHFYPDYFICNHRNVYGCNEMTGGDKFYHVLVSILHLSESGLFLWTFLYVFQAIKKGKIYLGNADKKDELKQANYRRAARTAKYIFGSFCICWLPIYVMNILDPTHCSVPVGLRHFIFDLFVIKSAINPMVYIYGVRSLRNKIQMLCVCQCANTKLRHVAIVESSSLGDDEGQASTVMV